MNNQLNANYAFYVCVGFYPVVWSGTQFRSVGNTGGTWWMMDASGSMSVCVGFCP